VCFCLHTTGRFSGLYFYWCIKKKEKNSEKAQKEISQKTFSSRVGGGRHFGYFYFLVATSFIGLTDASSATH